MKRTALYIVLGVIVVFFTLSLLREAGILDIRNKTLLILLSVFAPLTKWIVDKFNSPSEKIKELQAEFEREMKVEEAWQADLADKVAEHDARIQAYAQQISGIDTRLSTLEQRKRDVEREWANMTEDEKERALRDRFN